MRSKLTIDWQKAALRRAQFLLDEARSGEGIYDGAVRAALRVISNVATVNGDYDSAGVKRRNPHVSQKAYDLYQVTSDAEWHKLTTNEHPEPIKQVWDWIVNERASLSPADIFARFKKWPMITVTCEEDKETNRLKFRHKGTPAERHAHISKGPLGPPSTWTRLAAQASEEDCSSESHRDLCS